MRRCPLSNVIIPCSQAAPLCGWCTLQGLDGPAPALLARPGLVTIVATPHESVPVRNRWACLDCGVTYQPTSARQQRCPPCGVLHTREMNLKDQHAFRQRNQKPPQPPVVPDVEKHYFEVLAAGGMSANRIAVELGHNPKTVRRHLARSEARTRVGLLQMDRAEPEQPR